MNPFQEHSTNYLSTLRSKVTDRLSCLAILIALFIESPTILFADTDTQKQGPISHLNSAEQPYSSQVILTTINPIKIITQHAVEHATKLLKKHDQNYPTDTIKVTSLIPSSNDPHIFEPKFSSLKALGEATLWIRCGEPIELALLGTLKVKTLNLHEKIHSRRAQCHHTHEHSFTNKAIDTHFWLSPSRLKQIIPLIYSSVAKIAIDSFTSACSLDKKTQIALADAVHTELKIDAENACQRLSEIQTKFQSATSSMTTIALNHNVFSYLFSELGINVLELDNEERPLRTAQLHLVEKALQEHSITQVWVCHPYSRRVTKKLAQAYSLKIVELTPYETDPIATLEDIYDKLCSIRQDKSAPLQG